MKTTYKIFEFFAGFFAGVKTALLNFMQYGFYWMFIGIVIGVIIADFF